VKAVYQTLRTLIGIAEAQIRTNCSMDDLNKACHLKALEAEKKALVEAEAAEAKLDEIILGYVPKEVLGDPSPA
jgi:hypothetical protein